MWSCRASAWDSEVCDVEGHWDFFCNFVELCDGVKFKLPGNAAWTSRLGYELFGSCH